MHQELRYKPFSTPLIGEVDSIFDTISMLKKIATKIKEKKAPQNKLCPFCGESNPSPAHFQQNHQMDISERLETSLDSIAGYSFHLMIPLLLD